MDVGVPEDEPVAQRLSDVDGQNQQGRAVADEPDKHGVVDNVFEFILADDIFQQSRKEGAAAQGDDGQVGPDPQGEPVVIIHIGLVQALDPA